MSTPKHAFLLVLAMLAQTACMTTVSEAGVHTRGVSNVVIFLDVDGVLGATITRALGEAPVARIPLEVIQHVQTLTSLGEVVWATSWDAAVRTELARTIGLAPDTRSAAILAGRDPVQAKRSAIDRFLRRNEPQGGWRAAVWVDRSVRTENQPRTSACFHPLDLVRPERPFLRKEDVVAVLGAIAARKQAVPGPDSARLNVSGSHDSLAERPDSVTYVES